MPKLYLIPTPIGNLEDITLRAIRILKEVDLILAEDTRTTGNLLRHYNIETKTASHHLFNEHREVPLLVDKIMAGMTVVLVSDAGTAGIDVECLPGPTAFVPALVQSGIPCDRFHFEGFLPVKKGRQTRLKELALIPHTLVFYESPHKLLKTLEDFLQYFGPERKASISRELTKIYEETVRGSIPEILEHFKNKTIKGEFVIIVEGKDK